MTGDTVMWLILFLAGLSLLGYLLLALINPEKR
jgi:F subunit of K+-transporting ATPase (Potass_KdpF)